MFENIDSIQHVLHRVHTIQRIKRSPAYANELLPAFWLECWVLNSCHSEQGLVVWMVLAWPVKKKYAAVSKKAS